MLSQLESNLTQLKKPSFHTTDVPSLILYKRSRTSFDAKMYYRTLRGDEKIITPFTFPPPSDPPSSCMKIGDMHNQPLFYDGCLCRFTKRMPH